MTRHRREALLRRIAYAMVEIPRCEACGHVIDPSTASIARNRCRCRECLAPDLATRAALAAAIPPLPLDPARVRATVAAAQAFGRGVPGHRCGNHSQKDDRCTDACAAVTTKSGCVGSSRSGSSSIASSRPARTRAPMLQATAGALTRAEAHGDPFDAVHAGTVRARGDRESESERSPGPGRGPGDFSRVTA